MKVNSAIRYTIKQFINYMLENYGIINEYSANDFIKSHDYKYRIKDFYLPFEFNSGCSKIGIIFDDCNFVVKIPYKYFDILEENNPKHWATYLKALKREGYIACDPGADNDCQKEVNVYIKATKEGFAQFFAEEKKVMEYHNIPVYVQKKVDEIYEDCDIYGDPYDTDLLSQLKTEFDIKYNTDEDEKIEKIIDDLFHYNNGPFVLGIYSVMNDKEFDKLINFIVENKINDLHEGNIGYIEGKPVFMDYSGYRF